MFEGMICDVLVSVLGQYVEGINRETISVGVWSGTLELRNLKLRSEAASLLFMTIFAKDSPLVINSGVVDAIHVDVPWSQLRSSPVKISLVGLSANVEIVDDADAFTMQERSRRVKQVRLDADNAFRAVAADDQQKKTTQHSSTWSSWLGTTDLLGNVLQNIQIKMEDVALRIHSHNASFDFAVKSIDVISTDDSWQDNVFLRNTDSPFTYKLAQVEGFSFAFSDDQGNDNRHQRDKNEYIVEPMTAKTKLTMYKGGADISGVPSVVMALEVEQVNIAWSDAEYASALRIARDIAAFNRKMRSAVVSTGRTLWTFAFDKLAPGFQQKVKERSMLEPKNLQRRIRLIKAYGEAYRAFMVAKKADKPVEEQILHELRDYEEGLTVEDIILFRDISENKHSAFTESAEGTEGRSDQVDTRLQLRMAQGFFRLKMKSRDSLSTPLAAFAFQDLWIGIDTRGNARYQLDFILREIELSEASSKSLLIYRQLQETAATTLTCDSDRNDDVCNVVSRELDHVHTQGEDESDGHPQSSYVILARVLKTPKSVSISSEIAGLDVRVDGRNGILASCVQFWKPPEEAEALLAGLTATAWNNLQLVRQKIADSIIVERTALNFDVRVQAPRIFLRGLKEDDSSPSLCADLGRLELRSVDDATAKLRHALWLSSMSLSTSATSKFDDSVDMLLPPTSFVLRFSLPKENDQGKIVADGSIPSLVASLSQRSYKRLTSLGRSWSSASEEEPKRTNIAGVGVQPNAGGILHLTEQGEAAAKEESVSFDGTFEVSGSNMRLLDNSGVAVLDLISGGGTVKVTQSSERISGSFLLRAFSCVSYASREADPDVVFQAGALPEGSSEDPTEPDADTDSENADYFFRAKMDLNSNEKRVSTTIETQSLRLAIQPRVLPRILQVLKLDEEENLPRKEETPTPTFVDAPSIVPTKGYLSNANLNEALDAVQTRMDMSWSISLHSIFKEFQVDADLWDGTPFVQLHASTCSLNVTNTAETGLDVEAAMAVFRLRNLQSADASIEDIVSYRRQGVPTAPQSNFSMVKPPSSSNLAVEINLQHPRVVFLNSFVQQLTDFLKDVAVQSSAAMLPSAENLHLKGRSTSSFSVSTKIVFTESEIVIPRSSAMANEGLRLTTETFCVKNNFRSSDLREREVELAVVSLSNLAGHERDGTETAANSSSAKSDGVGNSNDAGTESELRCLMVLSTIHFALCEAQNSVIYATLSDNMGEDIPVVCRPDRMLPKVEAPDSTRATNSKVLKKSVQIQSRKSELLLCTGQSISKATSLINAFAEDWTTTYEVDKFSATTIKFEAGHLGVEDVREQATSFEKSVVGPLSGTPDAVPKCKEEHSLVMSCSWSPTSDRTMSLSLSGLRLFVIPSLMESLLKYRRPYDAYDGTQTKKKSETTPAAPVGDLEVSASGTRLAIYLCSNRHVSDRQAIALRGEIDYSMRQKRVTMKTVEVESRLEMANVSVAASYDVFSSTSEVELVSPCFLQVASSTKAETGQFVNGFIGSLHCRLDIRDIPLIRSCLSRVSASAVETSGTDVSKKSVEDSYKLSYDRAVEVDIRGTRMLLTTIQTEKCIPLLDVRMQETLIRSEAGSADLEILSDVHASIFETKRRRWSSLIEPWNFGFVLSTTASGNQTITLSSNDSLDLSLSSGIVGALVSATRTLSRAEKKIFTSSFVENDLEAWLNRPTNASILIRNETGIGLQVHLRRLKWTEPIADGEQQQVQLPLEQILSSEADDDRNGRLGTCEIKAEDFAAVVVPTRNGTRAVRVLRSTKDTSQSQQSAESQTLLYWQVDFVDGALVAVAKSDFVVRNMLGVAIELSIAGTGNTENHVLEDNRDYSIPCPFTFQPLRFRPAVTEVLAYRVYRWSESILKRSLQDATRNGTPKDNSTCFVATDDPKRKLFVRVFATVNAERCVELEFHPSLVLENRLPRPFIYAVVHRTEGTIAKGTIAPMQSIGLNQVADDLSQIEVSITYDNTVEGFGEETIPLQVQNGQSNQKLVDTVLELSKGRKFVVFSRILVRNRSDVPLIVTDGAFGEKLFRSRPLQGAPDDFVTLCSKRPTIRTVHGSMQSWTVPTNVDELESSVEVQFADYSLLLFARPSKVYEKTTEIFLLNSLWIENRLDHPIQCKGLQLSSKQEVGPGEQLPLHLIPERKQALVSFKLLDGQWKWSPSLSFETIGELPIRICEEKGREVYIPRLSVTKTSWGARKLSVKAEDIEHPPFVIHNACGGKQVISFLQRGADPSLSGSIYPGEAVRYAWDIPKGRRDTRILQVRVKDITGEDFGQIDASLDKSGTNVLRTKNGNDFDISVTSNESTMLVEVTESGGSKKADLDPDESSFGSRAPQLHSQSQVPVIGWDDLGPSSSEVVPTVTWEDVDGQQNTKQALQRNSDEDGDQGSPLPELPSPGEATRTLNLRLSSVGISVITDDPVELLRTTLDGVRGSAVMGGKKTIFMASIDNIQVDNLVSGAKWPVAVWFPSVVKRAQALQKQDKRRQLPLVPALQLTFDQLPSSQDDVWCLQGLHVALQSLTVCADETLALQLINLADSVRVEMGVGTENLGKEIFDVADVQRVQLKKLLINPIGLTLSFTMSRSLSVKTSRRYRYLVRPIAAVFGNIENVKLCFDSVELDGVFDTAHHLATLLRKYYYTLFAKQRMRLTTSSKILGNPAALFDTVAASTKNAFFDPSEGASSADFLARSAIIPSAFAEGIASSFFNISGAVTQGIEALTDDDFNQQRQSILRGGSNSKVTPSTGLFRGVKTFGLGLQSGLMDLVYQPTMGAMSGGAAGFAEGVGRGITSALAKPLAGGLDMVSQPVAGLANVITSQNNSYDPVPRRPPRRLGRQGEIPEFDWRREIGNALFAHYLPSAPYNSQFVGWTELTAEAGSQNRQYLSDLWQVFSRFIYLQRNPLQEPDRRSEAYRKRLALVSSTELVFYTFTGEELWRLDVRDIGSVTEETSNPNELFISVPSAMDRSAHVNCTCPAAKNKLLELLVAASARTTPPPPLLPSPQRNTSLPLPTTSTKNRTTNNQSTILDVD